MKTKITLITVLLFTSLLGIAQNIKEGNEKIQVLNIGTFHMGQTSDAKSTEYDEASKKAKQEIKEVNEAIAKFKPTIILVEEVPEDQESLEVSYSKYLQDSDAITDYSKNEIQLLAFEIGRLTKTKKIFAIDHKMGYNYNMAPLAEKLSAKKFFTAAKTMKELQNSVITDIDKIGLYKMLLLLNSQEAYDFLININADMLMYVNSKDNFEGADEASKFYQRNIRMFGNINKIEMTPDDRVLIISGATHAAFFNEFMKRSPVYDLVPITDYLKK